MSRHGEGDDAWHKSSRSGSDGCVEIRLDHVEVRVRNSRERDGPVLCFTHSEWHAFLAGAADGEFDPPTGRVG